jgi:hypothetical protein
MSFAFHETPKQMGLLEFSSIKPGLSDNGLQGPDPNCTMVGNWDGDRAHRQFFLHDYVASPAAYFLETMSRQN